MTSDSQPLSHGWSPEAADEFYDTQEVDQFWDALNSCAADLSNKSDAQTEIQSDGNDDKVQSCEPHAAAAGNTPDEVKPGIAGKSENPNTIQQTPDKPSHC